MSDLPRTRLPRFLQKAAANGEPVAVSFARLERPSAPSLAPAPTPPEDLMPEAPRPPPTPPPTPLPLPELTPPMPLPTPPPLANAPDQSAQLIAAVRKLELTASRLAEQARSDALEIGFQVARRIIDAELKSSPEPLFAMIKSAVRRVGEARRLTVRLHPDDAALLKPEVRERIGLTLMQVELIPDPRLERGDCLIDSETGSVDGRVEARLHELKRAVTADLSPEEPDELEAAES